MKSGVQKLISKVSGAKNRAVDKVKKATSSVYNSLRIDPEKEYREGQDRLAELQGRAPSTVAHITEATGGQCAICWDDIEENDPNGTTLMCGHRYHKDCFGNERACSICRRPLRDYQKGVDHIIGKWPVSNALHKDPRGYIYALSPQFQRHIGNFEEPYSHAYFTKAEQLILLNRINPVNVLIGESAVRGIGQSRRKRRRSMKKSSRRPRTKSRKRVSRYNKSKSGHR